MNKPVKAVLVGAGGYGSVYAEMLLGGGCSADVKLVAAVEPNIENIREIEKFKSEARIYKSFDEFFSRETADLAIIASPIQFHFSQCVECLRNGLDVLCEKPLVPTLRQLDALEDEMKKSGRTVSVGFQSLYSGAMLALKKRALAGDFGRPVAFKYLICWPRGWNYYSRSWAGKINSAEGEPVNDSIASNATAHYIQNIIFLLGSGFEESAELKNAGAQCFRANKIESFDTISFSAEAAGAKVYFYAAHPVNYQIDPIARFEYEDAVVYLGAYSRENHITIHHKNGRVERPGDFLGDGVKNKLVNAARFSAGEDVFVATTKTVRPFTAFVDEIFTKKDFKDFPESAVVNDAEEKLTYVKNLHAEMINCYEREIPLPY